MPCRPNRSWSTATLVRDGATLVRDGAIAAATRLLSQP
jgi:DNA integrity scanning protein DisA with diadenylate cyclase activity